MSDQSIKEIILKVNGDDAQKELDKINTKLEDTKKKRKELTDAAKGRKMTTAEEAALYKLDKQIGQCNKDLRKMTAGADEVSRTLHDLDNASPKNLQRTLKALKQSLSGPHMKRGSKEWKAIQEKIKLVKTEIQKVADEQREAMSMSDRFAEWGQKWMGIAEVVETTTEALSGMKASAAEAYQAFLNMDEAMVGVKKYTGLSEFAIYELNQVFKQMDTRTPREKLNALAADAGRLGITTKEAIIDFVTAANMINVALGEDLGEDAVKNIGKLAQLFGDDQKMGLKQAMISTGSVINDLAQSSSANEGYIMDFTARLAGMAKQANMSQAQVMALASVMDQAMVNSEEGSTALMKVIQQIYREPEKMAKAAGLEVSKFTTLVKTDANEALLQFAEAVSKMGGMDKIAPMLGDLSLTGAGVSKAIATLANNVDKVRSSQAQATEAFRTGASVVNEYNTANNSAMAQAEKRKKQLQDLRVELGEKLQPVMSAGLMTTSDMIKVTIKAIEFGARHIASIVALTATIATFVAIANRAVIAEKAMALWSGICDKAQRLWAAGHVVCNLAVIAFTKGLSAARKEFVALNATMKTNVFGLIAAAISVVVVALTEFIRKDKEAAKSHLQNADIMSRISQRITDSTQEEITRVRQLVKVVNDSSLSYDIRRAAVQRLQAIVPGWHKQLKDELTINKDNVAAINDYILGLQNKAKAEAYYAEMVDTQKKIAQAKLKEKQQQTAIEDAEIELATDDKYKSNWGKTSINMPVSGIGSMTVDTGEGERNLDRIKKQQEIEKQKQELIKAKKETAKAESELSLIEKEVNEDDKLKNSLAGLVVGGSTSGGGGDDAANAAIDKLKLAADQQRMVKRLQYDNGIIDYDTYSKALLQIDIDLFRKQRDLHTKNSAEWLAAENKRLDATQKLKESSSGYSLKQIEADAKFEEDQLTAQYLRGTLKKKDYEDKLTQIQLEGLKKRAAYLLAYAPGSAEQQAAQTAYQDALESDKLKRHEDFLAKAAEFDKQYNKKSDEEKKADELKTLDELVKAGYISEEKKQQYIKEIEEKYRGKDDDADSPLSGSTDPISAGVIDLGKAIGNLEEKLKNGKATWQDYAAVAVASLGMISTLANAGSQLMQANIDLETAKITKRYDAEISAAGKNSRKAKKLEEKKQAEIAKVKNKYATKAMVIQMAGAVAQTAVAAINAYSSAAAIPVVGHIMAPIAAAAAVAAGMIQIATIRRQQQAQAAGYYRGGFTGGTNYRNEAGVVHEGEFVANHETLANPHLLPILQMIDYAQRNNRVASLTDRDVSRAVSAPQQTASVLSMQSAPVIIQETSRTSDALDRLNAALERGIHASVNIAGDDGIDHQMKKYNRMINRKNI